MPPGIWCGIRGGRAAVRLPRLRGVGNFSGSGGVAEWSNASVLKTEEAKVSVGSNPTPSVFRRSRVEAFRGMRTQFEPEGRAADRRQAEQSEANPTPSVFRRGWVEAFR